MELKELKKDATAEEKRELGKSYYFKKDATPEEADYGIDLLWDAHLDDEPEALYWVAVMMLDGIITLKNKDSIEYALYCMRKELIQSSCSLFSCFLTVYPKSFWLG